MVILIFSLLNSFFFFFSSRRRHTRLQGDWSSDVCSSDLFSLRRLDQICAALGLKLADLLQPPEEQELVTELSEAQELALVSQPKNFEIGRASCRERV